MWRKIIRWLLALFAAGATIVITLAVTLYLVTDTQKVLRLLEKSVAEETGGKLAIESLDFNAFRGFTGRNIKFEPPQIDGTVRQIPAKEFIHIKEFRLHYNLWALLYGTLRITRAQIHGGMVAVNGDYAKSEFQGITLYRIKSGKSQPQQPEASSESAPIGGVIRSLSKMFWIPIRIKATKIGIEHLDVNILQDGKKVTLTDLSALINLSAHWRHLDAELDISLQNLAMNNILTDKLSSNLSLQLVANQKLAGFDLRRIRLKILDELLRSETNLSIYPNSEDEKILSYSASHQTRLNVKLPSNLSKLLPLELKSDGEISFAVSKIAGNIRPDQVAQNISESKLYLLMPNVTSTVIEGKKLQASLPSLGLSMTNYNFAYQFDENRKENDNIQISSKLSHSLESLNFRFKKSDQTNTAYLRNISASMTNGFHFPLPTTATSKLAINIGNVGVEGDSFEPVSVPFSFEVDADSADSLRSVFLHQRLKLGELLSQQLIAKCTDSCQTFELSNEASIPSFEKIWSQIKANASRMLIPKFVPEEIKGQLAFKSEIKGSGLLDGKGHFNQKTNALKLRHETALTITDLSLAIPANRAFVKKAAYSLNIDGSERKLSTSIHQTIDEVGAQLEGKAKKTHDIRVHGVDLKTNLVSNTNLSDSVAKILDSVKTSFNAEFSLGKVDVPSALNKPLTNIKLTSSGNTSSLRNLNIQSLKIVLPDLATAIESAAELTLNDEQQPTSFNVKTKVSVDDIPRGFVKGFDAKGSVKTEVLISSSDMDTANLTALIDLQNVSASFQSQNSPNISAEIQDISGTIPLQQAIQISSLKKFSTTPTKQDRNTTADDGTQTELGAIDDDTVINEANNYLTRIKPAVTGDTRITLNQDYANFREFYTQRRPIKVRSARAMNLSIENIEVDLELTQNQLAINNAVASFLGGKLHADFKLAFDERPTSIKTSFHATRINTEKLVKTVPGLRKKSKNILSSSNPLIDAAAHLNYDLRTGDMQGGLSITSIGKDQLRMILYYIDPGDRDATISAIKTALNFGDVKLVSVPIKNGEIGLDVNLRLLSAPIPTPKLQGFPIAKLINNFREQGEDTNDSAH